MADGRFAPSPTGPLHVGNLRTALLAWLFARVDGGRFLVRVEDLDPVASREAHVESHLADLVALGLDHDGDIIRQSDPAVRERHEAAVQRLDDDGLLYPCFCSRREVAEAVAAAHGPLPEGAYPGTCRDLTDDERAGRAERRTDRGPALRVRADLAEITIVDRLHGSHTGLVDDFVVRRGDGVPAYNVAVVVDDAAQGIAEVVRGDDLLEGTPRQVWLHGVLGLPTPAYAHVPLVLGPDGERLAKRHGSVTRAELEAEGWSAARLLGVLGASIGLAGDRDEVTAATLLERFDPDAVPTQPWVFDPTSG
ncbi:tRNA glutamyl-Q(34) synthetase GluQRS [Actinospongicola halichondriae]|uniref:tRNA glutamyl-Q(34) synthetase GluQRS n=1 Tax=Actinospongicola halichondriae TaxID=3236844 RepID=UPI003D3FD2F7